MPAWLESEMASSMIIMRSILIIQMALLLLFWRLLLLEHTLNRARAAQGIISTGLSENYYRGPDEVEEGNNLRTHIDSG